MKALCAVVLVFLEILGLTEVIKFLALKLFVTNPVSEFYVVVPLDCEADKLESKFRSIASYFHWQKYKKLDVIIYLTDTNFEKAEICRRLCDEYGFLFIN